MAKKKMKTNGYVAELNKLIKKEYGEIPAKFDILIRKTAKDMFIMDSIGEQLSDMDDFTSLEMGSMGQQKLIVTPLLAYYDKASARVSVDMYDLGLTARKQAVKAEDPKEKEGDKFGEFLNGITAGN